MSEHEIRFPLSDDAVRELRVGDSVHVTGPIFASAGLPTYNRLVGCIEGKEALPLDMKGGALFHLGSLNEERPDGSLHVHYMNPTTSTRFNDLMPRLIPGLGLRATGGKGGLDGRSVAAMREAGCVYLAFLGGGAPLITAAIRRITDVAWPEMISHYRIVRMEVDRLGPLTVGIDAHGNSLYETTMRSAMARRDEILRRMREQRGTA